MMNAKVGPEQEPLGLRLQPEYNLEVLHLQIPAFV